MDAKLITDKIRSGKIRVWSDLFKYVSVETISKIIGRGTKHVLAIQKDPLKMSMADLFKLAEWLDTGRDLREKINYKDKIVEMVKGDMID